MTTHDVRPIKHQIIINIDMEAFWREAIKVALLVAGCSIFAVFLHGAFTTSEPSAPLAAPSALQEGARAQSPQSRSD